MTLPALISLRTGRVSRLPFHWRGDRFSLTALSGQAATHVRAATAAPLDYSGVARTVNQYQPAWQAEDWNNDGSRQTPALLLGTSDSLYWTVPVKPAACTIYLEFIQPASFGGASTCFWYLGNAGNTGARLWIDSTGTQYRANHHNGTSAVTSTMTGTAPTSGQRVALRVVLLSTGSIQIWQAKDGASETTPGASGTLALNATGWSDTRLYANSTGSTNAAILSLIRSRLIMGTRTAAQAATDW